jgi:hypothetical protein
MDQLRASVHGVAAAFRDCLDRALASSPVMFYAGLFVCIDIAYTYSSATS